MLYVCICHVLFCLLAQAPGVLEEAAAFSSRALARHAGRQAGWIRAKDYTPEITKAKFPWTTPLASEIVLENATANPLEVPLKIQDDFWGVQSFAPTEEGGAAAGAPAKR